jgi:YHS domain-containing protein
MKRFLSRHCRGCAVAVLVFAAAVPASASDKQTSDPAQATTGNEPTLLAQNDGQKASMAKANVDSQGVILKGSDVVAYFKEGKPVKGSSTITSTYGGAAYLFASVANKAEFEKDPAKYVPQYGGFCAYGVTSGVLADPEGPSAFLVYKGKLYMCGNQGALKSFKRDIDSNIDKADKNWLKLTGS